MKKIAYPKRLLLNVCWARNLPMPPALVRERTSKGYITYPLQANPRGVD